MCFNKKCSRKGHVNSRCFNIENKIYDRKCKAIRVLGLNRYHKQETFINISNKIHIY